MGGGAEDMWGGGDRREVEGREAEEGWGKELALSLPLSLSLPSISLYL